ncbi:efflux RND transporter permease subunit, partial [Salmonella enterica subsp. enterica serovar Cerro]|nr:efflux RND transporter permease subunit [Salmonella enterica subsp. enterica serovar Cerro]
FGAQYAMRIWLDANLLNKYQLTPVDVINQLKVQNDQIAAGQLSLFLCPMIYRTNDNTLRISSHSKAASLKIPREHR